MEFAKNVLISVSRHDAHGCVQVCVLAVRPVLPSHSNQPQQPIGATTSRCVLLRWPDAHVVSLVNPSLSEDCPRRSRHLAGDGHCHDIGRSSRLNCTLPRRRHLRVTQHGSRAVDEQRAQVGVPSLRYAPQANLATGAALARHESQERSELTAGLEGPGIAHRRYQRSGGEPTDARHVGDRTAGSVVLLPSADPPLELVDLRLQRSSMRLSWSCRQHIIVLGNTSSSSAIRDRISAARRHGPL